MQSTSASGSCHTLSLLPFEVASQILSSECLDAAFIVRSRRVCQGWKELCDHDGIWHTAAHRWGYISDFTLTVQDVTRAKMDENGYFSKVTTWKDLCIAQELLDAELGDERRGEEIRYPVSYSFHAAQSETAKGVWQDLWRMKIIPEDGTIVSTGIGGGVRVSDLRTHELLWSIQPEMTSPYPHLEAEKGFLVWNDDMNTRSSRLVVYRTENTFKNLSCQRQRGHYRPWKVLESHAYKSRAFRLKYPHLANMTSDGKVTFWDIETGTIQKAFDVSAACEASFAEFQDIDSLDFDSEYVFLGSRGPDLHVFRAETGQRVWFLGAAGLLPNLQSPKIFDLEFHQDIAADIQTRTKSERNHDSNAGDVYRAVLQPRDFTGDWLRWLFGYGDVSLGAVPEWQAVQVCEETNTLVFCCNGVICLLKDHKRFFQDPSKDPEWFAAYCLRSTDFLRKPDPLVFPQNFSVRNLLRQEFKYWQKSEDADASLSVQNGRALWVSALPLLLDWRSAKSVEDVTVTLLWQDHESSLGRKGYDVSNEIDSSKWEALPNIEQLRLRQFPDITYKSTLRGSSCAILTQTAAYVVETQARRKQRRRVQSASRGAYGPTPEQSIAFRTVRCFDWGRSALLRLDKPRCHAEIEAFTKPPVRRTVQKASDFQYSEWTRILFERIMAWEDAEARSNPEAAGLLSSDDDESGDDEDYGEDYDEDYDEDHF